MKLEFENGAEVELSIWIWILGGNWNWSWHQKWDSNLHDETEPRSQSSNQTDISS